MTARRNEPLSQAQVSSALTGIAKKDRMIRDGLRRLGAPSYRRRPLNFRNLLRIIVGQQLTGKAAETIFGRVEDAVSGACAPGAILTLSDRNLRQCGLSRQKIASSRCLADAVESGALRLRQLYRLPDAEVEAQLTTVKGLGPWSAHMALLFLMGRPDVWPVGDLGVRVGVQRLLKLPTRPDATALLELGDRWQPHRSAMALMAWRAANASK